MKQKVYKLKENIDLNKFNDMDYDIIPTDPIILCKIIPQDFDGELVQGSLSHIYNNPEFRSKIYDWHKKEISEAIGLKYRRGKAVINDKFRHVLTDWRIQIEPYGDGWLGFSSLDPFDKIVYYNYEYIDRYCHEELETLLKNDLIELVEVEDNQD